MKLKSVSVARSIWLFPIADLNPGGMPIERNVPSAMAQRYMFAKVPTIAEIRDASKEDKGITFAGGTFDDDGVARSVDVTLYRDGVVCDTKASTDTSDSFLADFLGWLHKDMGLANYRVMKIRKAYFSELSVESPYSLELVNPKMTAIAELIASGTGEPNNPKMELAGLTFAFDPKDNARAGIFRFERAAGSYFETNRYWSSGPVSTKHHLQVLDLIEDVLGNTA